MKGGSSAVLSAFLLATVTAAAALPAPAFLAPSAGTTEVSLAEVAAQPELGIAFGQALAAQAREGSPTATLQAMLRAQGFDEAPAAVAAGAMAGAPADLAVPLGRILAAMAMAEELRAGAVAALTPEERAMVLEHRLWSAAPLALPALPEGDRVEVASPGAEAWARDPRAEAIAAKVDQGALRTAALTLLAAIEASAPELRVAAAQPGPSAASHCAAGLIRFESNNCEVVVGDVGNNAYTNAATLLVIDLGGNDAYTNGATGLAKSNVKAIVDNSGSDTYAATASAVNGAPVTAEGLAYGALGVAVLADLGGNDLYSARATTTAPEPGPAASTATIAAMGVADIGAGVLVDAGGRDVFNAYAMSHGGGTAISTQGQAGVGLGAVLNLGATDAGADDTYTALGESPLHITFRDSTSTQYINGPGQVNGQGQGDLGGAGILVDAGGNDGYLAEPRGAVATLAAQGTGIGGAGLLVDAQGNDAMTARALGDTTLSLVVNNGGNNICWTVTVTVSTGETKATAQGVGSTGAGALVDAGGNDVRLVEARSHAGAVAGVNTAITCPPTLPNRAIATATSGPGTALGQGAGATGVGALIDLGGADSNQLRGTSTALASAIVNAPAGAPEVETATATAGRGQTFGQAHTTSGIAVVLDAAGADGYTSATVSTATRTTGAGTNVVPGPVGQSVQAFGNGGLAWLLELDGADSYTVSPGTTPAGNNKCWAQGPDGGRGRDFVLTAVLLPASCP